MSNNTPVYIVIDEEESRIIGASADLQDAQNLIKPYVDDVLKLEEGEREDDIGIMIYQYIGDKLHNVWQYEYPNELIHRPDMTVLMTGSLA